MGLISSRAVDLSASLEAIAHRGPDARGSFGEASLPVHLGHVRLSILDLSESGSQPMTSHEGRWVTVFNGEIYNHLDLRKALPGRKWRGHSDTETLLEACAEWGVPMALERLHGMFALALLDRQERALWLARDRFGEKPLYVLSRGNELGFASELGALKPFFPLEVDRDALADYMRYGYVPNPRSIWKGCSKFPAGHYVKLPVDSPRWDPSLCRPYWNFDPRSSSTDTGDEKTLARFSELLDASVGRQMLSDVPLGAFLSGGVDSTLVVSSMVRAGKGPVRTFTMGIDGMPADEAAWAGRIAKHLGTEHHEFRVTPKAVLDHVEAANAAYDEPFGDPSQVPTWLVARMARQHVTVCLSGDAGDEVFGGYANYARAEKLRATGQFVPAGLAGALSGSGLWDRINPWMGEYAGHKIRRVLEVWAHKDYAGQFDALSAQSRQNPVLGGVVSPVTPWARQDRLGAQWADIKRYLPDDILVKVDRASMAHGLECRVPLLDPTLFEWAWQLPDRYKVRGGEAKWLMKELLRRRLPRELVDRPKQGFGLPLQQWLKHDLKNWVGDLLDPSTLKRQGYLDADMLTRWRRQHEQGTHDHKYPLWSAVCFQLWLKRHGMGA